MSKDTGIFREPPKPEGVDSQHKCATEGCDRRALSKSIYCADCFDQILDQHVWHQRQGAWSGKS